MDTLNTLPNREEFIVSFDKSYCNINDIITSHRGEHFKVLTKPQRKWYKLVLQFLTFGLYRAPWYYTVEPLNK